MKWLIAAVGLLLASAAQAAPTASCTFPKSYRTGTTLTVPASVWVACEGTTDSNADVVPFHELRYSIDYDDSACASGQGTWENSPTDAPKNSDRQPIGFHVYECAGTFTITVNVCDSAGACDTDSDTFTVESADAGWPGAETDCVSPTGDFTDCPSGADHITSSDFDASLQTGAGRRTLYDSGQTFPISANPTLAYAGADGSLVDCYGSDCDTNPFIITYAGTTSILTGQEHEACGIPGPPNDCISTLTGWRWRNFVLDFSATSEDIWGIGPNVNYKASDVQTIRVSLLDVPLCRPYGERNSNEPETNERIAWVSMHCRLLGRETNVPAGHFVVNHFTGTDVALYDAYDELTSVTGLDGDWGSRTEGIKHFIWAHSKEVVTGDFRLTHQFRTANISAARPDEYNVITDLQIYDDGTSGDYRTFSLWFSPGGTGGTDTEKSDYIFDGVFYTRSNSHSLDFIMFEVANNRTTIRNNVVDLRDWSVDQDAVIVAPKTHAIDPDPEDLWVYNNTILRDTSHTATLRACDSSGVLGFRCVNNLIVDLGDADDGETSGSFEFESNNDHIQTCPFIGDSGDDCTLSAGGVGFDFDELRLSPNAPAYASVHNTGFDFPDIDTTNDKYGYVYSDGYGGCRGSVTGGPDAEWDIGAHEYGSVDCLMNVVGLSIFGIDIH